MMPEPRAPRKRWWGAPDRPPVGAIPRFPVWELTVVIFMGIYGVAGLANLRSISPETADGGTMSLPPAQPPPGLVVQAIGSEWAHVWYGALIIAFLLAIWGMLRPAPDGIIISLIAMVILCVASGAVAVGLVAEKDRLFFPGITTLYVFFFGSFGRVIQCVSQLRRLERRVRRIAEATHDVDR